jgi:hypothetical protein
MRVRRTVASAIAPVAALAAVAAGAVGLSLQGSPAWADLSVDQSYPVPKSGTYTLHGLGFGDGKWLL